MNNINTHIYRTHGNSPIEQTLNPSTHKNQEFDFFQLELNSLPNTKNLSFIKNSMLNYNNNHDHFTCEQDISTLTIPLFRAD